jgi:hypothetical protein
MCALFKTNRWKLKSHSMILNKERERSSQTLLSDALFHLEQQQHAIEHKHMSKPKTVRLPPEETLQRNTV